MILDCSGMAVGGIRLMKRMKQNITSRLKEAVGKGGMCSAPVRTTSQRSWCSRNRGRDWSRTRARDATPQTLRAQRALSPAVFTKVQRMISRRGVIWVVVMIKSRDHWHERGRAIDAFAYSTPGTPRTATSSLLESDREPRSVHISKCHENEK